jgi:hypothetical protein
MFRYTGSSLINYTNAMYLGAQEFKLNPKNKLLLQAFILSRPTAGELKAFRSSAKQKSNKKTQTHQPLLSAAAGIVPGLQKISTLNSSTSSTDTSVLKKFTGLKENNLKTTTTSMKSKKKRTKIGKKSKTPPKQQPKTTSTTTLNAVTQPSLGSEAKSCVKKGEDGTSIPQS